MWTCKFEKYRFLENDIWPLVAWLNVGLGSKMHHQSQEHFKSSTLMFPDKIRVWKREGGVAPTHPFAVEDGEVARPARIKISESNYHVKHRN